VDEALSKELLKTANQSGFPFQIGVRNEIERTISEHGWNIVAEEYPWTHSIGGKSGFIDLLAEHKSYIFSLVIECKRVRSKDRNAAQGPSWVFLTPRDYTATQSRLSGFMTHKLHEPRRTDVPATPRPDLWGWADAIASNPPAPESSYCLFETQDEKNPTIERIADTLLPSVEAVGKQWFTFRHVSIGTRRLFLPVIVTNATLYTCTFDAEKVSIADGGLSHGDFQEVAIVRFRKGLAMGQIGSGNASDFADANRQQQSTLLIVNSSSLASTLKQLELREEGKRSLWNAYERLAPATAVD